MNKILPKFKNFEAPVIRFTAKFNGFCRPVSAPVLTFPNACELLKVADIALNGAIVGRIVQYSPDKFLFCEYGQLQPEADSGAEWGYYSLGDTKSIFMRLVGEGGSLREITAQIEDEIEDGRIY